MVTYGNLRIAHVYDIKVDIKEWVTDDDVDDIRTLDNKNNQKNRSSQRFRLIKDAIFPQKEGRKREISNESTRGSSLDQRLGERQRRTAWWQDTVKTLRTIIWYKRACICLERDNFPLMSKPLKTDVNQNFVTERFLIKNSVLELGHVTNVTIFLNETAVSEWGSRFPKVSDARKI